MEKEDFLSRLNVAHPIIQAPMGGGPSTPELVAAVSNAGGIGSLGAAYQEPEEILESLRRIRRLTEKPFQVNLFAEGRRPSPQWDAEAMLAILKPIHLELGLGEPQPPPPIRNPYRSQLEALVEAKPPIVSFTFGIPGADDLKRLHRLGAFIFGTATTLDEAHQLFESGADAIIAQGAEAGGHHGSFDGSFRMMTPTLELVRHLSSTLRIPVIAAGGIMNGRQIAAALRAGAVATQLGTAFLACPESGASPAYKSAVLSARSDATVMTRVFSGRPARGIKNRFIELMEGSEAAILPYPIQNALTRAMRKAAAKGGNADYLSLWAGTGVPLARAMPAAQLVAVLAKELESAR